MGSSSTVVRLVIVGAAVDNRLVVVAVVVVVVAVVGVVVVVTLSRNAFYKQQVQQYNCSIIGLPILQIIATTVWFSRILTEEIFLLFFHNS